MVKDAFPESVALYQELVASSMRSFGLKTVEAKIYSFVYCSLEPVSLEDISHGTGYSLATVSTVTKYLSEVHILLREKRPGSKKLFFDAQRDVSEMMVDKLNMGMNYIINPRKESLPRLVSSLKKELKSETSKDKKSLGKQYLKILEADLNQTLLLEKIYRHTINYISKNKM